MAFKMKNQGGTFKTMGSSPYKVANDADGDGIPDTVDRDAGDGTGKTTVGTKPAAKPKMANDKWKAGSDAAKKNTGQSLNDLVAARKGVEKGSNEYNKIQNSINKALGNSKRYDVKPDAPAKGNKMVDGQEVKKGLGAEKGKTLTAEAKTAEKAKLAETQANIKDAKSVGDRDARDKSQLEKAQIQSGRDDKFTGTVASRTAGKIKAGVNKAQINQRAKNVDRLKEKAAKRKAKGKSTERQERKITRKTMTKDERKANKAAGTKNAPAGTTYDPEDDTSNMPSSMKKYKKK